MITPLKINVYDNFLLLMGQTITPVYQEYLSRIPRVSLSYTKGISIYDRDTQVLTILIINQIRICSFMYIYPYKYKI